MSKDAIAMATENALKMEQEKIKMQFEADKINIQEKAKIDDKNIQNYKNWITTRNNIIKGIIDKLQAFGAWLTDVFKEFLKWLKFFLAILFKFVKWAVTKIIEILQVLFVIILKILKVLMPLILFLCKYIFFILFLFLFFWTLYYLIWFGRLPPYSELFRSFYNKNGEQINVNYSAYNENTSSPPDEEPKQKGPFESFIDFYYYSINMMIASIHGIFAEPTPPIIIPRPTHTGGRCDEVNNIRDGNTCVNCTKIKDIVWNLEGRSADYHKLPKELKKPEYESITIPYKEHNNVYIPDCDNSYYTNTKEKTGLLRNINSKTCEYVPIAGTAYVGELMRTGVRIDSYASIQ